MRKLSNGSCYHVTCYHDIMLLGPIQTLVQIIVHNRPLYFILTFIYIHLYILTLLYSI